MSCDIFFVGYTGLNIFPGVELLLPHCVFIVILREGGTMAWICNAGTSQDDNRIQTETSGVPPLHHNYK